MEWYYYLNNKSEKSLCREKKILSKHIVVCSATECKKFAVFDGPNDLYQHVINENVETRCFFECIFSNQARKPYFDIDIPLPDKHLEASELIKEMKNVIRKKLPESKIIVYSSHTSSKISYHLLVANYYLQNHLEAKIFADDIIKEISNPFSKYIDSCVYKSIQQFRLLGSHKYKKNNMKKIDPLSDDYDIPESFINNVDLYNFRLSLLTLVDSCDMIKETVKQEKNILSQGNSSEDDIPKAIENVKNIYPSLEYVSYEINNGNILLTFSNKNGYKCKICNRIHDQENPYVIIKGQFREVFFDCRRKDEATERQLICTLGLKIEDADVEEEHWVEEKKTKKKKKEIELEEVQFPLQWDSKYHGKLYTDDISIYDEANKRMQFKNGQKVKIKKYTSNFHLVSNELKELFYIVKSKRCIVSYRGKKIVLSELYKSQSVEEFIEENPDKIKNIKDEVRKCLLFGHIIGIVNNSVSGLKVKKFNNGFFCVLYEKDINFNIDDSKKHICKSDINKWFNNSNEYQLYCKEFINDLGDDIILKMEKIINKIDSSFLTIANHAKNIISNM